MTVRELIEYLQTYPPDAVVVTSSGDECYDDIHEPYKTTLVKVSLHYETTSVFDAKNDLVTAVVI